MLEGLTFAYGFWLCLLWHWFSRNYLQQGKYHHEWMQYGRTLRMLSHWYTLAFLTFIVCVVDNVKFTWGAYQSFGFADPRTFYTNPSNLEHVHCHPAPLNWTEIELAEVHLDQNGWMRYLVIGSCPAAVLTQLVGWMHIFKHWRQISLSTSVRLICHVDDQGRETFDGNRLRDMAIQILFLPVMYSVIAYNNVCRLMAMFTGGIDLCRTEWDQSFEEKRAYTTVLYEANLCMGDLYEAIALYQFTSLSVHHIKIYLRRIAKQTQKENEAKHKVTRLDTRALEAADPVFKVTNVMSDLVLSGVSSFCLTAFLSFLRGLYLVLQMAWHHTVITDEGSIPSMLSGAGLVASTVAIANVVNVEISFHEELHLFNPGAKFWSTKIIVSIAFIQEAVLGLLGSFGTLSELQVKLVYCSFLCYEVFLVTLLHVKAWPVHAVITKEEKERAHPGKAQVDDEEYWEEARPHHVADAREPLLCIERLSVAHIGDIHEGPEVPPRALTFSSAPHQLRVQDE